MKKFQVTIQPDNKTVESNQGTTIAEAVHSAGISMNNLCGGEGVCGKCKVRVLQGNVTITEQTKSLLEGEEIEKGFVLACRTEIEDNLEINIPPESRLEGSQIMTSAHSDETENLSKETPLIRKIYLELSPPSLEDNSSDIQRISRELRKQLGWHSFDVSLSCLQNLSEKLRTSDWKITATVAKTPTGYKILEVEPQDTRERNFGIAVDVGTTTVVAQLIDISTGRILGSEGVHNFQANYGEDVISRMIYACDKGGLHPLNEAVVKNINQLIENLSEDHNIPLEEINAVVAAGNTTMSHFLLDLTPCSIRVEPYVPTADVYPQVYAKDLGINIHSLGILETLPSVASYVGGDIVAGVMACGLFDQPEVQILIDIGTNGEIALGNNEWLVCCSASAGPAFEGGGTKCGMRATVGAIEKIEINKGNVVYETIGGKKPRGFCGSGLIDAIYEMVKAGIIGADGKFARDTGDPRLFIRDNIPEYIIAEANETESGEPVVIAETDIDNLIKSKGAVYAAIKSLVDYIGLDFEQIDSFYVAGGFGSFLNIDKSIAIGLLPDIQRDKIQFIGNSSLSGARKCLLSEAALEKCHLIARSMTNIELSNYQPFMDEYIAALFLPHTNRKLFPSVNY